MEANKFVLADDAENKLLRSQIKKDDIDNVVNQVGDKEAVPFRVKVSTYEKKDSSKRLISLFSQANGFILEPNIVKGEKLGTANNEMVADESIKKKESILGIQLSILFQRKNLQSSDLRKIKCLAIHQSFM